jgi:Protein of unknown function (DUF3105)
LANDVPGRPDRTRRPTKAERKEQARLEREALQRRLATRKRRRTVGTVLVAGAIGAGILAFTLLPSGGDVPTPDDLIARASRAADAAGCGDVSTTPAFEPADQDRTHIGGGAIGGPPLSAYPTTPPASGPHADTTLPAGVYDSVGLAELYRSIHSLEHGASVIWYDPAAPAERVARVLDFYDRRLQDAQVGQDRVIVAPYDFPGDAGGVLPGGTQMALVAWHRLRTCASVDLAVAFDFTSQYSFPTTDGRDYLG